MRRVSVVVVVIGASLVAAGAGAGASTPTDANAPTLAKCVTLIKSEVVDKGHLTIGTDSPVIAPWFIANDPENKEGYEGALAYDIAKALGVLAKNVRWVVEPYALSYQAGHKDFDFDIDEVVTTPAKEKNVTMSQSYYFVQQSLVAMKSDPIVKDHSPQQLPRYQYGALSGSPAQFYISDHVRPKLPVIGFTSLTVAESYLESGKIDALAIDTPTGNHAVTWDLVAADGAHLADQVAQFPNDDDEYYGLVMQKRNPIAACVNVAVSTLRTNGTLARLKTKWLAIYNTVPVIKP